MMRTFAQMTKAQATVRAYHVVWIELLVR